MPPGCEHVALPEVAQADRRHPSSTIAPLMPLVGEDRFFWASDYPHPDHPGDYLTELREMVASMTESGRRGILGENVASAYRLT